MKAIKVTCSTGKVVVLREPLIGDQVRASESASNRLGESASKYSFVIAMNQEMAKLLLLQVGGKDVKASEREDIDSLLSYVEYSEVAQVVGKLTGTEKDAKLEFITVKESANSGDK